MISGVWWPSCHTRLLGDEGSELGLILEELLSLSWGSNPFCALKPWSGLIPNSEHTYLPPSGQCFFSAQPSTGESIPASFYTHPPFYFPHTWPPSLPHCSADSGQPGLATGCDPSFPTRPKASSPFPLHATFWLLSFFPQPHVSGFYRKIARMGWEGRQVFSVSRYEGKALPGRGLPSTRRGLASCLGWAPGSIPDESRQFLCPLGTVAACCLRRTKTY